MHLCCIGPIYLVLFVDTACNALFVSYICASSLVYVQYSTIYTVGHKNVSLYFLYNSCISW